MAKSAAQPSKQVLELILSGRTCINITHNGQARCWMIFETPAHCRPEGQRQWRAELRGGWPEETLAVFDVFRDIATGRAYFLAEGWEHRMMA